LYSYFCRFIGRRGSLVTLLPIVIAIAVLLIAPAHGFAQNAPAQGGGEAHLILPDLSQATFMGVNGRTLLMYGLGVCALGLLFGLMTYKELRDLPVHQTMRDVSELIWETCKTYLFTQGKFLLILEIFIGVIILFYFGYFEHLAADRVIIIMLFSLLGIAGSYSVAWYGIRVNTFANSRTAFASLRGFPYPCYQIPLRAGMSIGMVLISVELLIMLCILLFIRQTTRATASSASPSANRWARRHCAWRAASSRRSPTSAPI